jgi:hypothetical protein
MDEATIALTTMTGLLLALFLFLLIWGWRSGQFKNTEDARFIIFRHNGADPPDADSKPTAPSNGTGGDKT